VTISTSAFYANDNTDCFISEHPRGQLNTKGIETTLYLRRMQGESTIQSTVVNNLIVSRMKGANLIQLPQTYTREELPVGHSQIQKTEIMSNWPHLYEATRNVPPYSPDIQIVLLIGSNCPKAHIGHVVGPFMIHCKFNSSIKSQLFVYLRLALIIYMLRRHQLNLSFHW